MKIELQNDELVISADRRYVPQLRALTDRRWDSASARWYASYTRENYEQMQGFGWPLAGIPAPARSAFSVDLVKVIGETAPFFAVRTPQRADCLAACRAIPEARAWSSGQRCWLAKATARNRDHLREKLPQAQWSPLAFRHAAALTSAVPVTSPVKLRLPAPDAPFKFKTAPYAHQLEAFQLSRDAEVFALLMEQRTGKTKVVIDTAAYLRAQGQLDAVLVVCPNSVKDVWVEQLAEHLPEWAESSYAVDGPGREARELVDHLRVLPKTRLKWLITNVEALASADREKVYALFMASHRTLLVADEFTRFKNPTARRTKALLRLKKYSVARRILSGTPATQSPLDVYAPYKFLDPAILGFNTWTQCRAHHAIMGGWQAKQVVGFVKVEEIATKIAPHSYRKLAKDCFDLPDSVYSKRVVTLAPEQRRIYDDLRDELVAELSSGEKISTAHALTRMLRLAQITGGHVVPDLVTSAAGEWLDLESPDWNSHASARLNRCQAIPGGNPKLTELLEVIDDLPAGEKLVIWARFVAEVDLITAALREKFGATSAVDFQGRTTTEQRSDNRQRFQGRPDAPHDPRCRFFVGQVETGGVGIRLSAARTAIYFSNSFSLETRLQSEMRITDDQKVARSIIDLVAKDTLDGHVLSALRAKKKFADSITGDAWRAWL